MAQAGFQELKQGMVTGGAVLLLNEEKKIKYKENSKSVSQAQEGLGSKEISIFFKSTEQNTRTGSKTKTIPLRTRQDGAIKSCKQAEPGKKPRGHGILRREASLDP